MALECKVKSFDNGILVGEIVNVCACLLYTSDAADDLMIV